MKYKIGAPVVLLAALLAMTSWAGGHHCCHCGRESGCKKVCRLVCETKEVTKVTYDCKCEDICVPGPSTRTPVCSCGSCDECGKKAYIWTPHCAQVKTRKVPVKREEKVLKPTYKWVVEYVCDQCTAGDAPHTAK